MKRVVMVFLILSGFVMSTMAQDKIIYTCIVNKVPDGFNFPLIGFFNQAQGSHTSVHIGLGNVNEERLNGVQIGLINLIGGETNGSQVGLINTSAERVVGLQLGLVNAAGESVKGSQVGLVNAAEAIDGAQLSLVNATEVLDGVQVGLVNGTEALNGVQVGLINATETLNGTRLGLVNAAEDLNGVELGLVNVVENLNGFQLGLVNVVETIDKGVPFGLISIVKEGGFRALEVSTTEMFPVNLSYKIGMKSLYTSFVVSYLPELPHYLATGIGVGSIIPLSESFYFNPELLTQNRLISENSFMYSLGLNVGYKLTDKLHLSVGSSIVWNNAMNATDLFNENFAIKKWELDSRNNLFVGARIGIRYVFTDFD